MEKRVIPKFETEAEEAKWWFDHRDEIAEDFVAAQREGRLGRGIKARYAERLAERAREAEAVKAADAESSSQAA